MEKVKSVLKGLGWILLAILLVVILLAIVIAGAAVTIFLSLALKGVIVMLLWNYLVSTGVLFFLPQIGWVKAMALVWLSNIFLKTPYYEGQKKAIEELKEGFKRAFQDIKGNWKGLKA